MASSTNSNAQDQLSYSLPSYTGGLEAAISTSANINWGSVSFLKPLHYSTWFFIVGLAIFVGSVGWYFEDVNF